MTWAVYSGSQAFDKSGAVEAPVYNNRLENQRDTMNHNPRVGGSSPSSATKISHFSDDARSGLQSDVNHGPAGVVYFISPLRSRRVKIGFTTDLKKRIRSLQATNHVELSVLLSIPGDQGLERRLHREFAHLRQHNEWFRMGDEVKEFIYRNGGPWIPPKGSYSAKFRLTEDEVREALVAAGF